jgi:hypothetical protein
VADRQVSVRTVSVVAAAVASAAALAACGDDYEKGAGVYTAPTTTAPTPTASTSSSTSTEPPQSAGPKGPDESAEADPLTTAQRRDVDDASGATRAFLAGYLPYSYGQADAHGLRSVSPQLRDELERNPPRVPPAKADKARPRLRRLEVSGVDTGRVILLAHIDDGESRYAALVTLNRRGDRWVVTEVQ